jgi:hypothetical protein
MTAGGMLVLCFVIASDFVLTSAKEENLAGVKMSTSDAHVTQKTAACAALDSDH